MFTYHYLSYTLYTLPYLSYIISPGFAPGGLREVAPRGYCPCPSSERPSSWPDARNGWWMVVEKPCRNSGRI